MANYSIPQDVFVKAAEQYGTPLWIYDRATIEKCVKDVQVFDTVRFAQKACPNLSVVSLIRKLGCVVDAVSAGEIVLYQPEGEVKLEVRVENETVWLTQGQNRAKRVLQNQASLIL
jgi:diaminopimelate decarboxylase